MVALSKQDIQTSVDMAKNRIIEKLVTRRDLQIACDSARDRVLACSQDFFQQNQQLIKQVAWQVDQNARRNVAIETRLMAMDQEVRNMRQMVERLVLMMQDHAKAISVSTAPTPAQSRSTEAAPNVEFSTY